MEAENNIANSGLRNLGYEVMLALATLTLWPILDERASGTSTQRARALVFTPVIGFVAGVALGLIDRALVPLMTAGPRSLVVVFTNALAMLFLPWRGVADLVESLRAGSRPAPTGLARVGPAGGAAALAAFAAEVMLLSRISDPDARTGALVMASMLGRWSIVPVGYGLKAGERWGLGLPFEDGLGFREFALSSIVALGLTLALYASVGLVVTVVLASLILGLRLLFSRRLGGVPGFAAAGASGLVEITVMATVAALSR